MNQKPSKVLNSQDVYREFFGEPGKVNISPQSERWVDEVMKSVDPWANDNQYKDAVRYALGKQAEMGERFDIPTKRMIQGVKLEPRDITKYPDATGYYNPYSDTIHLPEPADVHRYVNAGDLETFLHRLLAHEHDHYLLAHSIGRPFEAELQKANQLDRIAIPSINGLRSYSYFRRPYKYGLPSDDSADAWYGAEDFGRAYPSEELPEISGIVAGGKIPPVPNLPHRLRRAVILKKRMLQSLHKQGIADTPNPAKDLYDDIYGRRPVTTADEATISNTVKQAMQKLAAAKEILRNVLAFQQNQNLGLPYLATYRPGSNAAQDFRLLQEINKGVGIKVPAFDGGWNPNAFKEGLKNPVSRSVDPLMHNLAKSELIDPGSGHNMNNFWPTPMALR